MDTCGVWRQNTVHSAGNISKKKDTKRVNAKVFAQEHLTQAALEKREDPLFAAYSSYHERGGRPYWLLKVLGKAWETRKRIKNKDGSTIPAKNWVVKAQWYLSTSDNPQRRSYELLDDVIHVQVSTLVQEAELEFDRAGQHERILSDASHVNIMSHNFSNVRGGQR